MFIVLNWWALLAWKDEPAWTLVQFLVLVLWSVSMLVLSVAVYPPGELANEEFEDHRRVVLLAVAGVCVLDIVQTAIHGALFTPVSYLPYVLHIIGITLVAVMIRNRLAQRIIATYLPLTIFIWGFVWTAGAMG